MKMQNAATPTIEATTPQMQMKKFAIREVEAVKTTSAMYGGLCFGFNSMVTFLGIG